MRPPGYGSCVGMRVRGTAAGVAMAAAAGVTGCGHQVAPHTGAPSGVRASTGIAAQVSVPVVVAGAPGQAVVQVSVTLPDGRAHPFLVDTGAAQSTLDITVARALRLPVTGSFKLSGVTGATRTKTVRMTGWRLDNIRLPQANVVLTQPMPRVGPRQPAVEGLLGGDVLRSFGAVTVDYTNRRLVLGRD